MTIDLRNYGQSDIVSSYEDLGLKSFNDVLGAYDFLKTVGFKSNSIGLHGISLGAVPVIFAANKEQDIKAIWADSSLACLLYTSPSPRDGLLSRMPSSA